MAATIRVKGVRELVRAADAAGKETKKLVRDRLRKLAEPILRDSQAKLARYDARSASRLGISVRRVGTVAVEQRLRRTTGAHPQFGSLQMHQVLIPSLEQNTATVMDGFDAALDDIEAAFRKG